MLVQTNSRCKKYFFTFSSRNQHVSMPAFFSTCLNSEYIRLKLQHLLATYRSSKKTLLEIQEQEYQYQLICYKHILNIGTECYNVATTATDEVRGFRRRRGDKTGPCGTNQWKSSRSTPLLAASTTREETLPSHPHVHARFGTSPSLFFLDQKKKFISLSLW